MHRKMCSVTFKNNVQNIRIKLQLLDATQKIWKNPVATKLKKQCKKVNAENKQLFSALKHATPHSC